MTARDQADATRADDRLLAGRSALVTGAGRGIGRDVALALAEAGADVTLVARSEPELRAVAREVEATGGAARVVVCDVTNESALETALGDGPVHDIVVNSAGMNVPQPFVEVAAATYDAIMDLNVRATFLVTQLAVRRLLDVGKPGVIINISSQMGHVGARNRTVYCASKHAVEGLTKALGVELAPHGIRVVSVAPTFLDTPMTRPFFENPEFRREVLDSIPMGRLGSTREVAEAVVFLASDRASLITGTSLILDGGWTAK